MSGYRLFLRRLLKILRNPMIGSIMVAVLVLAILLPVWLFGSAWYENYLLGEVRAEVNLEVALRANALSAILNRRIALLDGLHAFVQSTDYDNGFRDNFLSYAEILYAGTTGIRNLTVAPGGTVNFVYPVEGDLLVLGYDPLEDLRPEVRADAARAIASHQIVLSDPIELLQGGVGLVARKAVYKDTQYWGMVNLVIDLATVLKRAGVDSELPGLDLALLDDGGTMIEGNSRVLDASPSIQLIDLPDGKWQLAAVPLGGWRAAIERELLFFRLGTGLIGLLVSGVAYLMSNRQAHLSLAVEQRTKELSLVNLKLREDIEQREKVEAALREREMQYRSIFEAVNEGLFINSLDGQLVDFNPAAAYMHGYTVDEFRKLQPPDFIHPSSQGLFEEYIAIVRAGGQFRGGAVDVRKDGTTFPVIVSGTQFIYQGKMHTLAVARDVTEEQSAYQLLEQRVAERTHELSTLLEISRNLASALDLEPLLDRVLEQLRPLVDFSCAEIYLLEMGDLVSRCQCGQLQRPAVDPHRIPAATIAQLPALNNPAIPIMMEDIQAETASMRDLRIALGLDDCDDIQSVLLIPMWVGERWSGMIVLYHPERAFYSDRLAELAMAIGNQAAVAIENARLHENELALASLEERQRLARELHDSISQALYGIALGARTAHTLLDRLPMPEEQGKSLEEPLAFVLAQAEVALVEMRALIFELRPETLESEGLVAALTKLASALRARHHLGLQTEFGPEPEVSLNTKQTLYRIAQEGLHNVIKHASAQQAILKLSADDAELILVVRDDGRGFDPTSDFPGHLGLRSMRERTAQLGGYLSIESAPSRGTTLSVRVPLSRA